MEGGVHHEVAVVEKKGKQVSHTAHREPQLHERPFVVSAVVSEARAYLQNYVKTCPPTEAVSLYVSMYKYPPLK
jgi:hypothetical protein